MLASFPSQTIFVLLNTGLLTPFGWYEQLAVSKLKLALRS